jgi:drug/metabolite transporter (DMT)-like permease
MPSHHSQTLPRSMWALVILLTLGWGLNWPMMKMALAEIPVWSFRGVCTATGAVGLFLIAWLGKQKIRIPDGEARNLIVISMFNVTAWNVLIGYGLTMLPSGRTAIIAYTMPLWTVLLSRWVLQERLSTRRILGVALGLAGMALLIGSELAVVRTAPLGALLVLGGALSWAIGTVLMRKYPTSLPTTSFTAWQLVIGGMPIVIGGLILEWGQWRPLGGPATIGLVYNMFFVFIFCYWAWFRIAASAPPTVAALSTLMIPVVGVFSGMWLLGESPHWQEYAAMVLVIASLATVLVPPRSPVRPASI